MNAVSNWARELMRAGGMSGGIGGGGVGVSTPGVSRSLTSEQLGLYWLASSRPITLAKFEENELVAGGSDGGPSTMGGVSGGDSLPGGATLGVGVPGQCGGGMSMI